ncbi:MAG: MerR family transcriptional regulator [Phenylobacterium sp.]
MSESHQVRVVTTIGVVSDALGLTPRAIRHYEEHGLVALPRDGRNRRLFDTRTRAVLQFVAHLRRADVPLAEIRRLLRERPAGHWIEAGRASLSRRREEISRQLVELEAAEGWFDGAPDLSGRR